MDTNLKKSKLIRAFIYRLLLVSSLVTMLASGIFGREALVNVVKEGPGILTGDIYYLTEMREYMADLFQNYMISHVGVADDQGYALTDDSAYRYELECNQNFVYSMKGTFNTVVYHYQKLHNGNTQLATSQEGNIDFPLYSENDGHLLETDKFRRAIYWDGPLGQLRFFDKVYNHPQPGKEYLSQTDYSPQWDEATNTRFVLGYKEADNYSNNLFLDMQRKATSYQQVLILFLSSAALFVLSGLLCLFSTRKFALAARAYSSLSRRILMEGKLIIAAAVLFLWLDHDLNYTMAPLELRMGLYHWLWIYYPVTIILYLLWLDLRVGKADCLKNSILYKCFDVLRSWNTALPWKKKMQRVCLVLAFSTVANAVSILLLLSIFGIMGNAQFTIIILALCILFICQWFAVSRLHRFIQDTAHLLGKIDLLALGQPTGGMRLSKNSLLAPSALAISDLESGIEKAVEQENKSNRMRVELITNVSHDLKTPLTSIINYADLLSEEQLSPPAGEYVEALRAKAYRLKKMVQDVFELSKATTGNLPVEQSKLDLSKLVKQTLADMDEELSVSNLQFKLKISKEPLFILADGEKMYRVFQNLLVNAMQYSLPGSRVHISLEEQEGCAVAKMKNVSQEEMNFDTQEIVERFVRADASRTKEGSGLGLSIVQSFTQACGGEFSVSTDADLFTATIRFPLISEEEGITNAQTSEEI